MVNTPFILQQEELGLSLTLNKTPLFVVSKYKLTCDKKSDAYDYAADEIQNQ